MHDTLRMQPSMHYASLSLGFTVQGEGLRVEGLGLKAAACQRMMMRRTAIRPRDTPTRQPTPRENAPCRESKWTGRDEEHRNKKPPELGSLGCEWQQTRGARPSSGPCRGGRTAPPQASEAPRCVAACCPGSAARSGCCWTTRTAASAEVHPTGRAEVHPTLSSRGTPRHVFGVAQHRRWRGKRKPGPASTRRCKQGRAGGRTPEANKVEPVGQEHHICSM